MDMQDERQRWYHTSKTGSWKLIQIRKQRAEYRKQHCGWKRMMLLLLNAEAVVATKQRKYWTNKTKTLYRCWYLEMRIFKELNEKTTGDRKREVWKLWRSNKHWQQQTHKQRAVIILFDQKDEHYTPNNHQVKKIFLRKIWEITYSGSIGIKFSSTSRYIQLFSVCTKPKPKVWNISATSTTMSSNAFNAKNSHHH